MLVDSTITNLAALVGVIALVAACAIAIVETHKPYVAQIPCRNLTRPYHFRIRGANIRLDWRGLKGVEGVLAVDIFHDLAIFYRVHFFAAKNFFEFYDSNLSHFSSLMK